ncbi:MAG: hypothetical protein JXQ65_10770 [Candidatus Marinimicrobia bacterium]|nr:hypothetical protein [Candidatus Neomarinimicrobiota bacterium]
MNHEKFAKTPDEIREKIKFFYFNCLKPNDSEGKVIKKQHIKSLTLIVATDCEVKLGGRNTEFMGQIYKIEVSETCYWFEMIIEISNLDYEQYANFFNEIDELFKSLTLIFKESIS